jgi:molecular chaperone GrpE
MSSEEKSERVEEMNVKEAELNGSDDAGQEKPAEAREVSGESKQDTFNAAEDPVALKKKLAEASKKAEDYYNRLARLQADYDNFRRRTRQETESLNKYASEQLVCALLPVMDNFERAMTAEGDTVEGFKTGVELIYRQLQDVLAAEGLAAINAVGEEFDPARHEAVFQVETEEYAENTVIEEFRRGYCLKDKVIRPSMVKVAKKP